MSLAFLVGNDASAVEDNLFEDQTVRLGYFYRPSFQEGMQDDEQKNGFGYEYLQKISYLSGWRYEYVYGTFETLFVMFKSGEIETCFNALYGLMMLRLNKKEVSPETLIALNQISKFVATLAAYFKKDEEKPLFDNDDEK